MDARRHASDQLAKMLSSEITVPVPRLWAPVALSLAVHGALLGSIALVGGLRWPAPPIPIELLPGTRSIERQGPDIAPLPVAPSPPSKAEPARTPPSPRSAPRPGAATRSPRAEARSAPKSSEAELARRAEQTPQTSDLRPFAPGDSWLVLMLRSARLRTSVHREAVERLLSGLPDYRTLVEDTGIHLFDDVGALVIATSNPYDVTATFLAASFASEERARVMRVLGAKRLPDWDPRVFRALGDELAVLARPDVAAAIDAERADGGAGDRLADGGTATGLAARLAELGRKDDADKGPALLVTLGEVGRLMRFGGGFPTPTTLELAVGGEDAPRVELRATMASPEEAQLLSGRWPEIVSRYRAWTGLLGIGGALDRLTATPRGNVVEVTGIIPEAQLRLALAWAGMRLEARNPRPRPLEPASATDLK